MAHWRQVYKSNILDRIVHFQATTQFFNCANVGGTNKPHNSTPTPNWCNWLVELLLLTVGSQNQNLILNVFIYLLVDHNHAITTHLLPRNITDQSAASSGCCWAWSAINIPGLWSRMCLLCYNYCSPFLYLQQLFDWTESACKSRITRLSNLKSETKFSVFIPLSLDRKSVV